jgi:hypothetical protein
MKPTTEAWAWKWIRLRCKTPEEAALAIAQMGDIGLLSDKLAARMIRKLQA